jgi:DNA repair protein RadC
MIIKEVLSFDIEPTDEDVLAFVKENDLLYSAVCRAIQINERPRVSSPAMVFELFCSAFEREQEMAAIIALRRDGQVLGVQEISRGTRHATMMDPSEIIIAAAKLGATSVILLHCHPGGDSRPSDDDVRVTIAIGKALNACHMSLVDHVIVGAADYTSLKAEGYI